MITSASLQTVKILQYPMEVQEAALPLVIWLIIGVFALLAGIIYATKTDPVKGTTMAVLGMQASGKTQFYKTLQNIKYTGYEATSVNDYEGFDIKLSDRTIHIRKGIDIGGTEAYIKQYYKKMICDNEIVVFVFDVYRYLNDSSYSRNTNARFDFINRHRNEKSIVILGSHLDNFPESKRKNIIEQVQQRNNGKDHAELFSVNFFTLDMRSKEAVQKVAEKIFKDK